MRSARSDTAPGSVAHRFPAASVWTSTPGSAASFSRRNARASAHFWVNATRCAPLLVAGQGAQGLEFGDGAPGIERRAHVPRIRARL